MRIDSTGIYTSTGQPGRILPGKTESVKPGSSTQDIKKQETPSKNFASLLSEAETSQLTKLFGKFDANELSNSAPVEPEDDRPGQIIDILV